jgi:hypothetical protein
MTAVNPPESGHEPSDLSELSATDALLDRLGRREPSDDDLTDATAAALAGLVSFVDESREVDPSMARLVEVLAGRPLYVTEPEEPAALERPAKVADPEPPVSERSDSAARLAAEPRVIDLTERNPAESPAEPLDDVAAAELEPAASVVALPRRPAARWQRALAQASLPAAGVLLLLALGGGLSAVVTGNPLTAVDGVSRAMSQLPGGDGAKSGLDEVNEEIRAARIAMIKNDPDAAKLHLDRARRALSSVPPSQRSQLSQVIDGVASEVGGDLPVPVATDPGIGVNPSSVPDPVLTTAVPDPSDTSTPTLTPTTPPGSPEPTTPPPTTDPPPSTGSDTPDTPATTAGSVPTAAASAAVSGAQS